MRRLNSKQLRRSKPSAKQARGIYKTPISFVLDSVSDTFNIGSFFRLADALAIEKIYLCGRVVTPPNMKIHRASVGLWRWVPWEQYSSTLGLVKKLKSEGYFIVSVEQSSKSENYLDINYKRPIALVFGNETSGVDRKVVNNSDAVAEIPLLGVNKSLNVLVAGSIISYHVFFRISRF